MPDVYETPDAPDPVLTEAQIQQLVHPYVPTVGRLLEVDESGGEARAYLLAGDVVVKTQRPHRRRPRTSLARERAILQALASAEGVRVPKVLGYGRQGAIEYLLLTRMNGAAINRRPVEGDDRRRVLTAVGEMLRHLHQVSIALVKPSEGVTLPTDASTDAVRERLDERAAPYLEELSAEWGIRWRRALQALPPISERCLLHSNPGPAHVFVDDGGSFSGLIDFGDAYVSQPALDLWRFSRPRDRHHVMEGYERMGPVSAETKAVWHRVMFLADLGVLASQQAWAQEARDEIESLGF